MNKFAVRMGRYMKPGNAAEERKSSYNDDSSSSASHLSTVPKVRESMEAAGVGSSFGEPETFEMDDGLYFDNIPAMSSDGMFAFNDEMDDRNKNNEL